MCATKTKTKMIKHEHIQSGIRVSIGGCEWKELPRQTSEATPRALFGVTLEGGVTTALADAKRRLIGCPKTFLQKWGDVEFKY